MKDISCFPVPGSCFDFKSSIVDFGLVCLAVHEHDDGRHFKMFPVKLDLTKRGLDRFRNGQVYVTNFIDFLSSTGITEGFMVYHFQPKHNVELMKSSLKFAGSVIIDRHYLNSTGGTMALTSDDFLAQLANWEHMFGRDGRLQKLRDVIQS
ncbi:MAG: hypothetical protein EOP06_20750 [Proteobacteria bacterium]|nr:MAG: hypothetical protein EOP06_20750 [Pseudomonadota bacterium]